MPPIVLSRPIPPRVSLLPASRCGKTWSSCEWMLVELYLKLRNQKIFPIPFGAAQAVNFCNHLRGSRIWTLVESAPVMAAVWERAARGDFAFRRLIDQCLGLVLRHFGVTEFAPANPKDFQDLGFDRVWNPLAGNP